jgi:hypothetical protein
MACDTRPAAIQMNEMLPDEGLMVEVITLDQVRHAHAPAGPRRS